jgi:hypothetical protein
VNIADKIREMRKASQPAPTATYDATRVPSVPGVGSMSLSPAVPNPSPGATGGGWAADVTATHWDDGVGRARVDVGGYPLTGHSGQLQAANDRVVGSMAMDVTDQVITGNGNTRGTDFNGRPPSPLAPGAADWRAAGKVALSDPGRR